jgi:hypothetical protein
MGNPGRIHERAPEARLQQQRTAADDPTRPPGKFRVVELRANAVQDYSHSNLLNDSELGQQWKTFST